MENNNSVVHKIKEVYQSIGNGKIKSALTVLEEVANEIEERTFRESKVTIYKWS